MLGSPNVIRNSAMVHDLVELRRAWADAYADRCTAIARLLDAKTKYACALLSKNGHREVLGAEVTRLESDVAKAIEADNQARALLRRAEEEFFGP